MSTVDSFYSSSRPLPGEGELYVGWSESSITPDKPVMLQGQFHERISEYVQSELVVTVLALETRDSSGGALEQMMIGACDLCDVSAELLAEVRRRLSGKLPGLCLDKLLLNATHTHTGPVKTDAEAGAGSLIYSYIPKELQPVVNPRAGEVMPPREYSEFLVERLCEAFTEAWQRRAPGLASWQLAHAVVGHNRRLVYDDGSAEMYGSSDTTNFVCIEGPSDHGIELLYLWDRTGRLSGVVVNVACPSQVVEGHSFISADYWGEVRQQLRERFSGQLFILPMCGAAGDQSPRDLIRRRRQEPSMHDVEGAVELGTRITDAVAGKYEAAAREKRPGLVFRHLVGCMDLPLRMVSRQEHAEAKARFEAVLTRRKPGQRLNTRGIVELFAPGGVMARYDRQQQSPFYSPEIHAIRLGEIAIATNPFELFADYGLRIKGRSRALQTFVVQLACGKGGYLPTEKAVVGGGYSAIVASGLVGPEGGRILVEQTVRLINSLFP
jgi:hypothetical protein